MQQIFGATPDGSSPRLMVLARITIAAALIGVAISYSVIYLYHLALVLLIVTAAVEAWRGTWLRRLPDGSHRFLYVMAAWYAASIAWSIAPLYSVQYLFYLFCGTALTLATLYSARDERSLRRVVRPAGIVIAIEVGFSLLEAFTPFRLPVSPYSEIVHYFGRDSVIEGTLDQRGIQQFLSSPTGFQWNPNDLAATLVIFLPFCLLHRSPALRYCGATSILVVIFFTGSRASYIAVAVVFAVWGLAFHLRRAVIVLGLAVAAVLLTPSAIQTMKTSDNPRIAELAALSEVLTAFLAGSATSGDSVGLRRELIHNGLEALRESPLLGVGGGASIAVQERAGGAAARIRSMHNFWIEVMVDSGVIMGGLFIGWYAWLLARCYRVALFTRRPYLRYVSTALVCSMSGFAIAMVSSSSVIYVLPMWFMYGLVCAVLNIDRSMVGEPRSEPLTPHPSAIHPGSSAAAPA